MTHRMKVVFLNEIPYLNTQTIWQAAATERSNGNEPLDLLLINWPREKFVSCGFHQVIETDIDLEYCETNNIPVVRRSCGGGQVYLDGDQIFYHIITHNDSKFISANLGKYYEQLLAPVVKTYQDFGIDCQFKAPNDIITKEGKKISGNGAGQMADKAKVLVGNLILSFPRKDMSKIIKVPDEKFRDKVFKSLEAGISSFTDELENVPPREEIIKRYLENFSKILDVELIEGELTEATLKELENVNKEYKTDEWLFQVSRRSESDLVKAVKIKEGTEVVQKMKKLPGGLMKILMEIDNKIIKDILITGDFWIIPENTIKTIEKRLIGKKLDINIIKEEISKVYDELNAQSPGTSIKEFSNLIVG